MTRALGVAVLAMFAAAACGRLGFDSRGGGAGADDARRSDGRVAPGDGGGGGGGDSGSCTGPGCP